MVLVCGMEKSTAGTETLLQINGEFIFQYGYFQYTDVTESSVI